MKTLNINLDGRFMRMITYLSGHSSWYYEKKDWDTCSLTRHVIAVLVYTIIKILFSLAIAAMVGLVFCAVGFKFVELVFDITVQLWWEYALMILLGAVLIAAMLAVGIAVASAIAFIFSDQAFKRFHPNPDNPAVAMYTSWKEKSCRKVTFK